MLHCLAVLHWYCWPSITNSMWACEKYCIQKCHLSVSDRHLAVWCGINWSALVELWQTFFKAVAVLIFLSFFQQLCINISAYVKFPLWFSLNWIIWDCYYCSLICRPLCCSLSNDVSFSIFNRLHFLSVLVIGGFLKMFSVGKYVSEALVSWLWAVVCTHLVRIHQWIPADLPQLNYRFVILHVKFIVSHLVIFFVVVWSLCVDRHVCPSIRHICGLSCHKAAVKQ